MSQVLQGYTSLGPNQSRKQFPRPPANQGQQACPDLGQAPVAPGFVSLRLEASRGHLILPLALSKEPSRQGSAIPALPLVGFSSHSEVVLPPILCLASPAAIFRPSLLVLSLHFLEIQSPCEHTLSHSSSPISRHPCGPGRAQGSEALEMEGASEEHAGGTEQRLCRAWFHPLPVT